MKSDVPLVYTEDSSLTLALPTEKQTALATVPVAGGGGREDCWTEGSTGVLISAWGKRYLDLNRGNLKEKHWKEVADVVSNADIGSRTRPPRTHVQCKYRIDTVKRKYKQEKAKIAVGQGPSKWAFFETMDQIIGPGSALRPGPHRGRRQPQLVDMVQVLYKPPPRQPLLTGLGSDSDTESDGSAEHLRKSPRPRLLPRIQPQMQALPLTVVRADRRKVSDDGSGAGELTQAMQRFVEVYERAEMGKMRQAMEMEKERLRFEKEAELERMQLLVTAQVEVSKLGQQRLLRQRERERERRWQRRREKQGGESGSNLN